MHDKARFYAGNRLADEARKKLTTNDIAARRDDHGNYVGAVEEERVHYHGTLKRGQNTTNACIARLLVRDILPRQMPVAKITMIQIHFWLSISTST